MNPVTNNPPTAQDFLNFQQTLPVYPYTGGNPPAALDNQGVTHTMDPATLSLITEQGVYGAPVGGQLFLQTPDGNWWKNSRPSFWGITLPSDPPYQRISQADISAFLNDGGTANPSGHYVNPFDASTQRQDFLGFTVVEPLMWILNAGKTNAIAGAANEQIGTLNHRTYNRELYQSVAKAVAFVGAGVAAGAAAGSSSAAASSTAASSTAAANEAGAGGFSLAEGGNAGLAITGTQAAEGGGLLSSIYSGAESLVTGGGVGTQVAKTAAGLALSKYEQGQQINTAKQIAAINAGNAIIPSNNILPLNVASAPANNSPIAGISKTELEVGAALLLTAGAAKMYLLP